MLVTQADTVSTPDSSFPHVVPQNLRHNGNDRASVDCERDSKIAFPAGQEFTSWAVSPSSQQRDPSMPVSTGSQSLLASLPSFMSVFGDGQGNQQCEETGAAATQVPNRPAAFTKRPGSAHQSFSTVFRRDSTSTFESVESSPTTTISTAESLITEPSPSSSPESPNSSLQLHSLKAQKLNYLSGEQNIMESKEQFSSSFPLLPGVERNESPNKKMRNTKNLSVNTAASNRQASQLSKITLSNSSKGAAGHASSAPPTPAFIVPPKAPRRKPSNLGLTITTPDSSSSGVVSPERPAMVPQTPSDPQIRTLRLLQTSSGGGPLFSPTHAPEGGMRLPPINSASSSSNPNRFGKCSRPPLSVSPLSSSDTTVSSPITKQTLDHVQEETDYELPLSNEQKSPAYPQGPICIYDPNVFLYLEPTQVEAQTFDVVLNVAREVKNPFAAAVEEVLQEPRPETQTTQTDVNRNANLAGRDSVSEPQTAVSEVSFTPVFEAQAHDAIRTAPSTPKAIQPEPEYIHVPWDHNANVVDDLLRLCRIIDDRVRQNKRVLIHCQCGVSRSASLVVAYGIYKNPQLTVQEAYDAVKNRSRWIGPNMNLIYQLSEFKTKLQRYLAPSTTAWQSWRPVGSLGQDLNSSLIDDGHPKSARMPQKSLSAPSPLEPASNTGRASSFSSPGPALLTVQSITGDITPGPSSAPSHIPWSSPSNATDSNSDDAIHNGTLRLNTSASLIDPDSSMTLSPVVAVKESDAEKEMPPAGGVARDLREVAKELDEKEPSTFAEPSTFDSMDMDTSEAVSSNSPETKDNQTTPKLSPQAMPGGFSSLLSRRQGAHRLPLRQGAPAAQAPPMPPPQAFNPIMHDDVPPTPSLLSPRAAEFTASPFHRTAAGDLAGSSVFEQGLMSPSTVDEDPRSPHQRGEAPITRSIFDMLESKRGMQ